MLGLLTLCLLALPSAQRSAPKFPAVVLEGTNHLSNPFDINELGGAVGSVSSGSEPSAAYWNPAGKLTVLGPTDPSIGSAANAINSAGIVVGYAIEFGHAFPARWTLTGGEARLPGPKPGQAVDVNSAGDILLQV